MPFSSRFVYGYSTFAFFRILSTRRQSASSIHCSFFVQSDVIWYRFFDMDPVQGRIQGRGFEA